MLNLEQHAFLERVSAFPLPLPLPFEDPGMASCKNGPVYERCLLNFNVKLLAGVCS